MSFKEVTAGAIVVAAIVIILFAFTKPLLGGVNQTINIIDNAFDYNEHPEDSQSREYYYPSESATSTDPSEQANIKSGIYDTNKDMNLLQSYFRDSVETMLARGQPECDVEVVVSETYRTFERSDYLYGEGRGVVGGNSYHNYGLAVDIYPRKNGEIIYSFHESQYSDLMEKIKCVGAIAPRFGIEWGGSWTNVDWPHFQDAGVTLEELQNDYPQGWQP